MAQYNCQQASKPNMTGTYRTRSQSTNAILALPNDRIRLITATRHRADKSAAKDRGSMPDFQALDLDNYAENQDGFAATGCRSGYKHGKPQQKNNQLGALR
jgi:hypothetical protein